jgi:hypothetical protein
MDFFIISVIILTLMTSFIVSYDIACIWSRHFLERAASYVQDHPWLKLPTSLNLVFLIPKFHLPVHIKRCWSKFSFNYQKYVGRTDGEGIERVWSWLNCIAYSVSMMTAGTWYDTLDDFCSFNNWRRTKSLGVFTVLLLLTLPNVFSETELSCKMGLAIEMSILHWRAYRSFTEGLRQEGTIDLRKWEQMIFDWEQDPTKPSLYEYPEESK